MSSRPSKFRGVDIVYPTETPEEKKYVIATADLEGNRPVIKVWPGRDSQLTEAILEHEYSHLQQKPQTKEERPLREVWKTEIGAERITSRRLTGKAKLSGMQSASVLHGIQGDIDKPIPIPVLAFFMLEDRNSRYGLSAEEIREGVRYLLKENPGISKRQVRYYITKYVKSNSKDKSKAFVKELVDKIMREWFPRRGFYYKGNKDVIGGIGD